MVVVLAFLQGAALSFDQPARSALIPELVPRDELFSAISLQSIVFTGASAVGPALAGFGLAMDSANPDSGLIRAIVEVSDQIPELRIVIDHLPAAPVPAAGAGRDAYWANLRHLSRNPNVSIKLSEIPMRVGQQVHLDPAYYRERLDAIWDVFGEDHILFGSDWPNSDHLASYADTLGLVRGYVAQKGTKACQKFFWKNSIVAYRWRPRRANQIFS